MRKKKNFIIIILTLVTFAVGVSAIFVGNYLQQRQNIQPEDSSAATAGTLSILKCGNVTNNNPLKDILCNIAPGGSAPDYCPSYSAAGQLQNTIPIRHLQVKFYPPSSPNTNSYLEVNGVRSSVCADGQTCSTIDTYFPTTQTTLNMRVQYANSIYALGWMTPENNECGTCYGLNSNTNSCTTCSSYSHMSTSHLPVANPGFKELDTQCWADEPAATRSDFDFNDFMFRVTGNMFPECSTFEIVPSAPAPGQDITIKCGATDDSAVAKVEFFYNAAKGTDWCTATTWTTLGVGVLNTVSGKYELTVKAPTSPGSYTYFAKITDNAGDACTGNPGGVCGIVSQASCPNCKGTLIVAPPTPTPTNTPTNTPTPTPTRTPTPTPTRTPTPTPTRTPTPTPTGTLPPSPTPSNTPLPTNTPWEKPKPTFPKPTALPHTAIWQTPNPYLILGGLLIISGLWLRRVAVKEN
ncbi:MAG: hypothetical protein WCJ58_04990 [bacterium]